MIRECGAVVVAAPWWAAMIAEMVRGEAWSSERHGVWRADLLAKVALQR